MRLFIFILFCSTVMLIFGQTVDENSSIQPLSDTTIILKNKNENTTWSKPKKATVLALTIPGSGQIYNKKYLKAAIVYGGFGGLAYMFDFNRDSLSKYQTIYAAKIDDDPSTIDHYPNRSEASVKSDRDFHRKYRDLSLIGFVMLYALQAIDANVDAHLNEFSLNKDLSFKCIPKVYAFHPGIGMYNGITLQYNF